jgi:hypothetical protein
VEQSAPYLFMEVIMKDIFEHLTVGKKEYPFVFNINVIQSILDKYGSLNKWSELIVTKGSKSNDISPEMMEALRFMCTECINEGIDMENDPEDPHYIKRDIQRAFITEKQAGRIMSAIEDFNGFALNTIIKSNDTGKEKNLTADQSQTKTE